MLFFKPRFTLLLISCIYLSSCSNLRHLSQSAKENVLDSKALKEAHVGISIYEPATNIYWYEFQGDKYFVPASNTKIPSCYAAMKWLGDSLAGLSVIEGQEYIWLSGSGDPSFLHPDFTPHPVYDFIKGLEKTGKAVSFSIGKFRTKPLGSGWAWNDYESYYMAERSGFPIYGNVLRISGNSESLNIIPGFFSNHITGKASQPGAFLSDVSRSLHKNEFKTTTQAKTPQNISTPFITFDSTVFALLMDTLHTNKTILLPAQAPVLSSNEIASTYKIYSQPTDSVLKPMMHRSDNFFAEQSLLMVSDVLFGYMDESRVIDSLLKSDFKDLPQKPRWVDGSGLSRYNLFSPRDFVTILEKMKSAFGMERIKIVFPTGGEGTISSYYKADSGFIYAKTGTLSGVVALSGFIYTKKGKELIFSILVNNHQATATEVRRAVEKFLQGVREKF